MRLMNGTYLDENFRVVHGNLTVKDGRIEIGADNTHTETLDCSECYIIPGLYNSHFYGYSLTAKGLARDMEIEEWYNETTQGKVQTLFSTELTDFQAMNIRLFCRKLIPKW